MCGKAEAEAGSVTCGTVRCSAWLGDVRVARIVAFGYSLGLLNELGKHEGAEELAFRMSAGERYIDSFIPVVAGLRDALAQTSAAENKPAQA